MFRKNLRPLSRKILHCQRIKLLSSLLTFSSLSCDLVNDDEKNYFEIELRSTLFIFDYSFIAIIHKNLPRGNIEVVLKKLVSEIDTNSYSNFESCFFS